MASRTVLNVPDSAGTATACPFCGQPLVNTAAVEHLAGQMAAYEAKLRAQADADVERRLAARETALKAEAAKQLKLAATERGREVAELTHQLNEVVSNQDALVMAEVRKQVAKSGDQERVKLQREFAKREAQLQATLRKAEEQNTQLSRRVERLSAVDRGEFTEDEIAGQLTSAFPDDDIARTKRGQRGADIFQHVRFRSNGELTEAGLIIYECKDTLHWSNGFVEQIRSQTKLHDTPYAVLVSQRFPPGSSSLAVIDDIVVVEPQRCVALAQIMRRMVIESFRSGVVAGSPAAKTAELFRFISSTQFRHAFELLSESVDQLDDLLTRERQSHQKQWTERQRVHQGISDTVMEIDAHFHSILEGRAKRGTVHVLRHEKSSA